MYLFFFQRDPTDTAVSEGVKSCEDATNLTGMFSSSFQLFFVICSLMYFIIIILLYAGGNGCVAEYSGQCGWIRCRYK